MEAANKQARQNGRKLNTEEAIFANILEQRQLVRQAGSLSKQRRRQEKLPSSAESPPASRETHTHGPSSIEIRPFPVEIWEPE
jgi:hypothetical protein